VAAQSKSAYPGDTSNLKPQTRFHSVAFPRLCLPSSLTSGSRIVFVRKMKKEPGLEDEVGPSDAQPHYPPLPTMLCKNVNPTPNSRQRTGPGMIFCSYTVYIGYLFSLIEKTSY